ncbi:MAG: ADP-ribosylglycohydrolase family protein [Bacteroidota bacterium]
MPSIAYTESDYQDTRIADSVLYDKILGSLVGSAIGDAMGAPTEMWSQWAIREEYGHVDSLDLVLREPSPEGPWDYNLPPGAGTDDTRWKALMVKFLVGEHDLRVPHQPLSVNTRRFAAHLNGLYESSVDRVKETAGVEPEPFEDNMRRMTWLQEWARVSRAYVAEDIDGYRNTLSRFYGGEMACAGMLYAPVLGAAFPGRPEAAYRSAYDLALFDLGYARDITGITAALTAEAFSPDARPDTLATVLKEVDPEGFFRSRLLGRVAYQQFRQARSIVRQAHRLTKADLEQMNIQLPDEYPYDSLIYAQTLKAYELLDKAKQDAPFHAGEIHLINLTALLFSDLEFAAALEFVTNYGRDNDTVAAVTGAILGALHGYSKLPREQRELVIKVNREVLDIDLEGLAWSLSEAVLGRRAERF